MWNKESEANLVTVSSTFTFLRSILIESSIQPDVFYWENCFSECINTVNHLKNEIHTDCCCHTYCVCLRMYSSYYQQNIYINYI